MFSSNQNVQYPLHPIFREYIAKFMNRCIQSANERKSAFLITNGTTKNKKNTENTDNNNSSYPSSNFLGGLIFLSISTGIIFLISRKK
jgi:hypothetical protein